VRDEDDGVILLQFLQGGFDFARGDRVESRGRFVEQDDLGLERQHTRQADALLLSAREREMSITMLVSTHDMALVKELFPRTIIMDERRIVADGLTMEILEDEKPLEAHGLERV